MIENQVFIENMDLNYQLQRRREQKVFRVPLRGIANMRFTELLEPNMYYLLRITTAVLRIRPVSLYEANILTSLGCGD